MAAWNLYDAILRIGETPKTRLYFGWLVAKKIVPLVALVVLEAAMAVALLLTVCLALQAQTIQENLSERVARVETQQATNSTQIEQNKNKIASVSERLTAEESWTKIQLFILPILLSGFLATVGDLLRRSMSNGKAKTR